jgi:PHS family inorganic phosphate transporter-like MFS transporter
MLAGVKSMQSFARLLAVAVGLGALRDTSRRMGLQPDALQTNDKVEIEKSKLVVDQVWRLVVGIAVIPAAVAILARLTIPETPRYYVDIMKDLRKAVKNAMKVYGRTKIVKETKSIDSEPARRNSDENDHWWAGAKTYLRKDPTAGRNLFLITTLWGLMDVGFYGLSMDSPSVLATLSHSHLSNSTSTISRRAEKLTCPDASNWKSDPEVTDTNIYHMLEINSIRSLLIASIASLAGSICAIIIVNRFRRRYILMVTFLILAILFGITGATLIASYRAERDHTVTIIFYAITQFFYNLGPNTMIFVLAAEIFPTVYRGTFYGIAAAGGKVGAIIIRAVIGATGNQDMSLGIRLLVFIPVMLLAALASFFLPDVQIRPDIRDTETATEPKLQNGHLQKTEHQVSEHNSNPTNTGQQNQTNEGVDIIKIVPVGDRQDGNESDNSSSDSPSTRGVERPAGSPEPKTAKPFGFFSRLQNMTLEDIAPNPILAKKKRKGSATIIRVSPADHGKSRQEASNRV